jgi:hypothetical protein
MLNVVSLNAVRLSVIMLCVVAPFSNLPSFTIIKILFSILTIGYNKLEC